MTLEADADFNLACFSSSLTTQSPEATALHEKRRSVLEGSMEKGKGREENEQWKRSNEQKNEKK